ncbi:MAG: hypothetical protein M0R76_11290 [Proteobacteria bacterium]|nr:hypothetical protein [Pseudomonadota bacterium]
MRRTKSLRQWRHLAWLGVLWLSLGACSAQDTGQRYYASEFTHTSGGLAGVVVADGDGHAVTAFVDGAGDLTLMMYRGAGNQLLWVMPPPRGLVDWPAGAPYMVGDENTTVLFTRWTDTTVDFNVYANGDLSTPQTYTDMPRPELSSGAWSSGAAPALFGQSWATVLKGGWATLRLGVCAAKIGGAVATGGIWLMFAGSGCALAATDALALLLNGDDATTSSDVMLGLFSEALGLYAGSEACDIIAMPTTADVGDSAQQCLGELARRAQDNPAWVDARGTVHRVPTIWDQISDGDDLPPPTTGPFAGSCDTIAAQGICVNYSGVQHTAQGARDACVGANGVYSTLECPAAGALKACYNADPLSGVVANTQGKEVMVVFYPPLMDDAAASQLCTQYKGSLQPYP